uniref:Retrotransposon Copia-like N-terminal domain-containing protein n=1 Tax=Cannabis sativa TaxID=3483 RepID=A0A803PPU3_CANSA
MASSSAAGFRPEASSSSTTLNLPSAAAAQVIPNHIVPLNLRLDRSNYLYWQCQVLSTVRAHQLEEFLTGARARPPATIIDPSDESRSIPNPELADWLSLDQFLMSWLFNSISERMLGHVTRCASSTKLWNVLIQHFTNTYRAQILHLRGLLQSTKKGSTTIEEYILKMRCLGDASMAAGQQITDDELILYILGGLGNEYDLAIVTLTSKESVTLQDVQFLLQTQEMRIDQQTSIATLDLHNPTANYAAANKKNPSSTSTNGPNSRGCRSSTRG